MIVIGDGVHNFMDGLSLGAGFRQSLSLGLSLTLSVLCEELPHELGDVAILLRSGLSIPLALLFNFGSACTAYIGLLVGVFVGELTSASAFIFALTAGFFLYIALVDMLPEVRSMEETVAHDSRQAIIRFFVHCSGMIFGFSCILTVVLTSDYINF
ncbi:Zinc transporter ZIP8 [Fasciola hepatica]|nr:Zinc transporter ZIP8 [Fasciola hepatica]